MTKKFGIYGRGWRAGPMTRATKRETLTRIIKMLEWALRTRKKK